MQQLLEAQRQSRKRGGMKGEKTTDAACETLARALETNGQQMLEKNYIDPDGEIKAAVFCVVGSNAAEFTALVREWANNVGMKRVK